MSIVLNDNLKIEAPKLIDARFGPHANLGAALAFITPALREMGLIFFVKDGSNLLEYWWPTTDLSDSGIALRSYQPLDADLTAIANIIDGGTGFLKKTAPNTWSLDTTVVTASTAAGGELEGYYPNPTLKNVSVINKVLAGFNTVGGGTIVDGDSILVAFGKVQNQLNALYGGMQFIDFWDASTNTPTIPTAALGNKGNYYIVQVAGSTNIGGITDWRVGDWVVSNGSVWSKIDNTDAVISVNGETGIVTLTTSHIEEGTRLYYTDLRVKTYADTLYSVLGHTHTFASLTSKPTTISGYGITDAYIKSEIDNFFGGIVGISGYNKTNWDAAFGWGNHAVAGYVKGTGVAQRVPYFSSTDTVTTSSRFIWDTAVNALKVNVGIAGTIGATLSGAFDGGSLQVWNGHELAVMGSTVGNSGDIATMVMKSNKGNSTANGYIDIQGYYAGGTTNTPIIFQKLGGVIIIGNIAAGADATSLLQVNGPIRQTSVTSALLKASANGTLVAAVVGTDYLASFTETDPTVPAYAKTLSAFSVIKTSTDALYEPIFSKNTAFNKNFGSTSGTVAEGNDSRINNGQTAFGWGNHAGLYSLLGHTHTFSSLTSKPTTLAGYGITDAATSAQGTKADTAYSWGDHSLVGYFLASNFNSSFDTRLALKSTTDLAEGINLYYTQGRFDSAFALKSTTNLAEGTNLYYTAARFNTAFAAKSTSDLSEGTNLYYTDARVLAYGDTQWVQLDGLYSNPTWITTLDWSKITSTPTTLAGYGITDGVRSVSGTAGKIFSSGGINPILTIDAAYIGQSSISNVGTITIGTWNGAAIADTYISSASNWNAAYSWGNHALAGYLTTISGIAAGGELAGTYANPTLVNSAVTGKLLSGVNITGGTILATDSILTAFGKVQNQINSLVDGMQFVDFWNATTNSPTIPTAVGNKGKYYIVQTAGTTSIDGITDWQIGDWVVSNGTTWGKIDNTDAVVSVNGFTGAVSLTTTHITEGTNLYFTDGRAKGALSFVAGTGSYNSTTGVITIPTHTSHLTNNSSFITDATSSLTYYYTKTEIQNYFSGTSAMTGYNKSNWDAVYAWYQSGPLSGYATQAWVAAGYQPLDSDLTAIAALNTTPFGRGLLTFADAPTLRTNIGLGSLAVENTSYQYYIGTTLNALNRASAAQTLTGVSIDGNAGTVGTFAETAFAVNQRGGDISLNSTIDSNTLRNGMYRVNSAVTSSPNSGRFWALNVYGNQSNVVSQLASDFQTGETFVRAYNSAWSAWRRVWDSVNLITATSTTQGLVGLFSDTVQSVAANAVTATASRSYGVQLNAAGQMVVNVPWTDTVYTHPTQTAIDTGTLSGANVVSRVSVNTLGHTTIVSTRALTPGDIGAQTALNGIGYVKMTGTTASYVAGATTNTASTVVERDGSGNFAAGAITATSFNGITGLSTSVVPLVNGTAAVGSSTLVARQDHVHPIDTSRAAVGQTMHIGTTALAINRASEAQTLTGVSIDGNAATATNVAASGITGGAALSLTDDTNVTISQTGSTTALLAAKGLVMGWSGTLADSRITSAATWHAKQTAYTNLTTIGALANANGFLRQNGAGVFSYDTNTYYLTSNPSGYISGNQTITLSGHVTGSGATSISTTIANGVVTTAMMASANISQWTNNSGYITGYTETDTLGSVTNRGNTTSQNIVFSNGRKGLVGVYDAAQTQAIFAMGAAYTLTDGGASNVIGNLYGLAWSYNPDYGGAGNNPQSKAGLNHQLLLMQAGVTTIALGSGLWTSGAITTTSTISASNFSGTHSGSSSGTNTGDQDLSGLALRGLSNVNGVLSSTYGGAGIINGILKANGSGTVSAAVNNSDFTLLNGTGFVRMSGTTPSYLTGASSQFVKADGSLDGNTYATTSALSGTTNYIPKFTSSTAIGNSDLRTDANNNLGLGVTPSAWGTAAKAFDIGDLASLSNNFSETNLATNIYRINTGASLYKLNGIAMLYSQSSGGHSWFTAPSGTAGATISFTERLNLSSTALNSYVPINGTSLSMSGAGSFGANTTITGSDRVLELRGPGGGNNSLLRFSDGLTAKYSTGFNNGEYIIYDDIVGVYRLRVAGAVVAIHSGTALDVQNGRTNLSYTSPGTAYTQAGTAIYSTGSYGPRLSLHWGGVVASQISVESSGRIAIINNPGTSYEAFIAGAITSTSDFVASTHGTFGGRTRVGAGYIADIGGTGNSSGIAFGASGTYPTDGGGSYSSTKDLGYDSLPWRSLYMSNAIRRTNPLGGYLNGGYAGIETTTTPGLIYALGDSYLPTSSALAAMYGIGYTYNSFAGNPRGASGWGFYVASAGIMHTWIGEDAFRSNVPIVTTSSVTVGNGNIYGETTNSSVRLDNSVGARMAYTNNFYQADSDGLGLYTGGSRWLWIRTTGNIETPSNGVFSAGYFDAIYSGSNGAYNGSFDWNVLQLGNNGPNYIVGGHNVAGGWLDFFVNNTNRVPGTTPNGIHAMRIDPDGTFRSYVANILYNSVQSPNHSDIGLSYNVNLGSGGSEGRGLVAGYSGGNYGGIGYNVRHTGTSSLLIAPGADYATYLTFNQGFTFSTDLGGTAGRNITFTTLARINAGGSFNTRSEIYPGYNNASPGEQSTYYLYGNTAAGGIRTNGALLANTDIYSGTLGVWLSTWLNQAVRTDARPTFLSLRADEGFTSASAQGRFGGWYNGVGFTGAAVEVGYSSGEGYAVAYNRNTSAYSNMIIAGTNVKLQPQGGAITATGNIVMSDYGLGLVGQYNSTLFQAVYAMGESYMLPSGGGSTGSLYGLAWAHPNAGGQAANLSSHGLLVVVNGVTRAAISGNLWLEGTATATSFNGNWNGYTYSNSGGANTMVQRDASGYIFNSYFNTSSGGAERNASGLGYFAGFNSSDYYIRSYTPTAARIAMGLATTDNVTFNQVTATLIGISSGVTINYNNDSASTYQMLWGSGNSVYGTAGIYCNPSTDIIYAAAFNGYTFNQNLNTTNNVTFNTGFFTNGASESDINLKNIVGYGSELNIADQIRVIRFHWKDVAKGTALKFGYEAQWIEQLIPNAVMRNQLGNLSVDYQQVHTVLIDENTRRIQALEAEVASLKQQLNNRA